MQVIISYGGGWGEEEEEVSSWAAAVTAVAADGTMANKNKMVHERIVMGILEMHSLEVSRRFFIIFICYAVRLFVCVVCACAYLYYE
jgi:hypothetical protein